MRSHSPTFLSTDKEATPFSAHSFPAPRLNAAANATYNFAVDITANGSASTFQCLYKQGYSAVFIQAYSRDYGGSLNPNLIQNLNNAGAANLGSELYVTLTTEKEGQPQFDAVYNKLKASGINLRSIWLQVTSPLKWNTNVNTNLHRIQNFINRGYATGVTVGIYTNWYDWQQITGSAFSDLRLWYWSATPGQFSLPYYQFLAISFTSRRIDGSFLWTDVWQNVFFLLTICGNLKIFSCKKRCFFL